MTKKAGEDESAARLAELKLQSAKSDHKLMSDLEDAQKKLDRLGFYNKSYDDIVDDIVKSHYREKHVNLLMDKGPKRPFPTFMFVMMSLAILVLGGGTYFLVSNPSITGAAVTNVVSLASSRIVSTSFGVLLGVLVVGLVFHKIEHRHNHKYDEYKPPLPPQ
ncbi:A10/OS-D family protein [Candidatus Woesearchaeota archaeon]|nr:A10/OS-D family protein [Candidatus Woesearchaeota archaeon]